MRLLVISNLYPPVVMGGYEIECAEVVEQLRDEHEVTVLTSSHRRSEASTDPSVIREIDLLPLNEVGALLAPVAAVRAARTIRRVLDRVRPDMAFVWNCSSVPHSMLCVLADSGTPIAYRICEYWFGGLFTNDQFMRYLLPGDHGGPGRAWAVGARAVNRLPDLRLLPENRTPAAIAWASEALRAGAGVPRSVAPALERVIMPTTQRMNALIELERTPAGAALQIAFLGRMQVEKGADVAVRALAFLRDEHDIDATLVLAGWGSQDDRTRLEGVADAAGVGSAVEIGSPLDADGVGRLFAQSDLLVAPSIWEEPSGIVILEGAAAGIPVVASRVGGMPEALHPDTHALFFQPGDARACAAAIAATLDDPEATAARTERARDRARELSASHAQAMSQFLTDAHEALAPAARVSGRART